MNLITRIRNKLQTIKVDQLERVMKKLPIIEDSIYFLSFGGRYSDSPKYVSEAVHRKNPDIRLIWSLSDPEYNRNRPDYIERVRHNSIKDIYFRSCSRFVIDNVVGVNSRYIEVGDDVDRIRGKIRRKKRKNQYSATTWHGTALKKMVKDEPGSKVMGFETTLDEMFWGDDHTIDIMDAIMFGKVSILKLGIPRNDILYEVSVEEMREQRVRLQLPTDQRIILFGPTFRNGDVRKSGLMQIEMIDFDDLFETLSLKFGDEWIMVCRFHYLVDKEIDWHEIDSRYKGKIINGNKHEDMAQYLAASDILITDYSSSMFDFSVTGKPVFLLCPDLDYYGTEERGFYLDIHDLPFPLAEDYDMLKRNIESFDSDTYRRQLNHMNEELGCLNDGKASERIAERILEKLKN